MQNSTGQTAIEKLSDQKGISEEEIRKEIELAIDYGMKSLNPTAKQFYATCKTGEKPLPEEVIEALIEKLKMKNWFP